MLPATTGAGDFAAAGAAGVASCGLAACMAASFASYGSQNFFLESAAHPRKLACKTG